MRYKEFNASKVLEDCISLFWKNGYSSCSIKRIVDRTGVNRFSLYNEFENKDGILDASLDLYKDRYSNKRIDLLSEKGQAREVLMKFFSSFLQETQNHPPGCYMIYIASELADAQPRINHRLQQYLEQIEKAIEKLLESDPSITESRKFLANRLTGLFCNSMCFCVIQSPEERIAYLDNSFNLIFAN